MSPTTAPSQTAPAQDRLDFESLVVRFQGMVFGIALHFLRDRASAEELAQEVFLELYVHREEIVSADHATYWLRKVASRKCIDAARRLRYRPRVGLEDAPEPFCWMPAGDPLLRQHIGHLVASLPEAPRLVVILRYQEDLDPAEIAETLDMPVATVKSHLQRSLALLRRKVYSTTGGAVR